MRIGVDLGGTNVRAGLVKDGHIVRLLSEPCKADRPEGEVVDHIASLIGELMRPEVSRIGIGVPSVVDAARGIVYNVVGIPSWREVYLKDLLEKRFSVPVHVNNDCNCFALGVCRFGEASAFSDVVCVALGTGVGGAVISDGHMVAGANGAAGEFGHMTINPAETETCACGRRGCVQQYVSASGIARLARKYLAEHEEESALRSVEKLTTKDVFDAAKNGDGAANAILENVYDAFGYTISAVCTVADPEVVVIGGGVSKAGEMLVEGVKKGFLKYVFYPNTDVRFNLAVLGNDAGIYGCCKLLLDSLA